MLWYCKTVKHVQIKMAHTYLRSFVCLVHLTNFPYSLDFNLPILAVHFWAPTFKWGISIANIADFSKPPEKISYPQQVGMFQLPNQFKFKITWPLVYSEFLCNYGMLTLLCGVQLLLALDSFGQDTAW